MPPHRKGGRKSGKPHARSRGQGRSSRGRGRGLDPSSASGRDAHPSSLVRDDVRSSIDHQGANDRHPAQGISESEGDGELPSLSDSTGFGSGQPVVHGPWAEVPVLNPGPMLRTEVTGEGHQYPLWLENQMAVPTGLLAPEGTTSYFRERIINESGPSGVDDPYGESHIHPALRQGPPQLHGDWDIPLRLGRPSHHSGPSYRGPDLYHSPLRRDPFNRQEYNWGSGYGDDYWLSDSHHGRHLGHESRYLTSSNTSSLFTGADNTTRGTHPFFHPSRSGSPEGPGDSSPPTPHTSGDFRENEDASPRICRRLFASQDPFSPNGGRRGTISDSYHPRHTPPWRRSRGSRSPNNPGNPFTPSTHGREPHTREPSGRNSMIRGLDQTGSMSPAVTSRFRDMSFSHLSQFRRPADDWETPKRTGQGGTDHRPQ
ncbi:hypothetical protein HOY82DRAFT_622976 [Tuber indicum]|nr:hypothetical protein HOY82DRAFT_622976 [Tuber indicum]